MTSGKARYAGGSDDWPHVDLTSLRQTVRENFANIADDDAQAFSFAIEQAAQWAFDQLEAERRSLTRKDIRAEANDLYQTLAEASAKLRRVSPELDTLLGPDANPLGCADALDVLGRLALAACEKTDGLYRKPRLDEQQRAIAKELAARVLAAARDIGVTLPARTAGVSLLADIGSAIRFHLAEATWREIVRNRARKKKGRRGP